MCGIFGVINLSKELDVQKVVSARDLLFHRGPDDSGVYVNKERKVALAHRRLSIIDLSSSARQPMMTEDGGFVIVYNGEIYNYKDLRQNLVNNGIKLRSNSDTEIILQLFVNYGKHCLDIMRGMFAFAIWDEKEKILFAARDRFGIKPFYFYNSDTEFIFSSELKAIKYYKGNLS